MRTWNRFTFWVFVTFGAVAAMAGVAGVALLFFVPGPGVLALVFAVVMGALSLSVKRSFDSVAGGRR